MPQKFHLNLILLAIVHSDGDQTIFSRALLDADFGPVGRNQHPARLRERTLSQNFGLKKPIYLNCLILFQTDELRTKAEEFEKSAQVQKRIAENLRKNVEKLKSENEQLIAEAKENEETKVAELTDANKKHVRDLQKRLDKYKVC